MSWILEQRALILSDYRLTDQETQDLLEVFDTITADMVESYPTIKLVPKTGSPKLLKTLATNVTARTLVLPPRPKTPPPPFISQVQEGLLPPTLSGYLTLGILFVAGIYVSERFR